MRSDIRKKLDIFIEKKREHGYTGRLDQEHRDLCGIKALIRAQKDTSLRKADLLRFNATIDKFYMSLGELRPDVAIEQSNIPVSTGSTAKVYYTYTEQQVSVDSITGSVEVNTTQSPLDNDFLDLEFKKKLENLGAGWDDECLIKKQEPLDRKKCSELIQEALSKTSNEPAGKKKYTDYNRWKADTLINEYYRTHDLKPLLEFINYPKPWPTDKDVHDIYIDENKIVVKLKVDEDSPGVGGDSVYSENEPRHRVQPAKYPESRGPNTGAKKSGKPSLSDFAKYYFNELRSNSFRVGGKMPDSADAQLKG